MRNIKHAGLAGFTYSEYVSYTNLPGGFEERIVTLGEDGVIGVWTDSNGELIEWLTEDTYWETAQNFATCGENFHYIDQGEPHDMTPAKLIALVLRERELYADCFSVELENI